MVETNEREELEALLKNRNAILGEKEEQRDNITKEVDDIKKELIELGEDLGQDQEPENN